jgi:hypothetical protein
VPPSYVDLVEDLADDVEADDEVGAAVADVHAHGLADLGLERLVTDQRALGAVEHHVGRVLVDGLLHVERLQALLAVLADRVEVALHHIELAIHRRQALGRLDQDQAVHAVGHVHADRRGGAVVDVQARVERLEGELRLCGRAR